MSSCCTMMMDAIGMLWGIGMSQVHIKVCMLYGRTRSHCIARSGCKGGQQPEMASPQEMPLQMGSIAA